MAKTKSFYRLGEDVPIFTLLVKIIQTIYIFISSK